MNNDSVTNSGEELDSQIINLLQQNPRASYSTIARKLGASDTTVRRRMNTLFENDRVRMVVLPDPSRVGFPFSALVLVKTTPGETGNVAQAISDLWQSTYVSEVVGSESVSCIVRERSLVALSSLINDTIGSIEGVVSSDSHVVTRVFKGWGQWRLPDQESESDSSGE